MPSISALKGIVYISQFLYTLAEYLKWDLHIDDICSEAQKISLIYRNVYLLTSYIFQSFDHNWNIAV